MDTFIRKLVTQQIKATAPQLSRVAAHVAAAPFATDLLEADEPLWGGFWQGDVIAPGYRLPAGELALLRATRLDGHWPERTTAAQFLADLRRAILHPRAGVWTLAVAGEPCAVFAAPGGPPAPGDSRSTVTVAWYCASTGHLHAGYRTVGQAFRFAGPVVQRPLMVVPPPTPGADERPNWTASEAAGQANEKKQSLAVRLDVEILRIRAGR